MIIITVDYRCIPGFNRNHQARTVRGACIDHPTRKYPQFKQDISVEHAAACEVPSLPCDAVILPLICGAPDATAIPGDSITSATCRPAPSSLRQCLKPTMPFWGCSWVSRPCRHCIASGNSSGHHAPGSAPGTAMSNLRLATCRRRPWICSRPCPATTSTMHATCATRWSARGMQIATCWRRRSCTTRARASRGRAGCGYGTGWRWC